MNAHEYTERNMADMHGYTWCTPKRLPNYFEAQRDESTEQHIYRLRDVKFLRIPHATPPNVPVDGAGVCVEPGDVVFCMNPFIMAVAGVGAHSGPHLRFSTKSFEQCGPSVSFGTHLRFNTTRRELLQQPPVEQHNLDTARSLLRAFHFLKSQRGLLIESLVLSFKVNLTAKETFEGRLPQESAIWRRSNWAFSFTVKTKFSSNDGNLLDFHLHKSCADTWYDTLLPNCRTEVEEHAPLFLDYGDDVPPSNGWLVHIARSRVAIFKSLYIDCQLKQDALVPRNCCVGVFLVRAAQCHFVRAADGVQTLARHVRLPHVEERAFFTAPIGYTIYADPGWHKQYYYENNVSLVVDPASARYWSWPHYFMTKIAPLLVEGVGLSTYASLWIIQFLPNMAGWSALHMLRALETALLIRQKVRAQRNACLVVDLSNDPTPQ